MILVDQAIWPFKERRWAHLISDVSIAELHRFAEQLGLERRVFQGDHYDVDTALRERAIALGAKPVDCRDIARALKTSGLRRKNNQRRIF